ncbi:MAG TPA: cupin domain-containing protein [Stellaceae bacterium]|jgi:uncharacterized cupin superfamily protein|nr:cupin domain-containing protein [Stellaceae bacterium]
MTKPVAITAEDAAPRTKPSNLPAAFHAKLARRVKQPLGDPFGLQNFGVNRTTLPPGGVSSLLHTHSHQDEFVYILEGTAVLLTEEGETVMTPGMCAGFAAAGGAHCLVNRSGEPVVYLEIGDRSHPDDVTYPQDDLIAATGETGRLFTHKDGTPY